MKKEYDFSALREFVALESEPIEETVRRVVREELAAYGGRTKGRS